MNNIIQTLNALRGNELFAISQYMNQHYTLAHIGWDNSADIVKQIAIREMKHAETLAELIKELGGEPITVSTRAVEANQNIDVMFDFDFGLESQTILTYERVIKDLSDQFPNVKQKLLEIVKDEKKHQQQFDDIVRRVHEQSPHF